MDTAAVKTKQRQQKAGHTISLFSVFLAVREPLALVKQWFPQLQEAKAVTPPAAAEKGLRLSV